MYLAKAPKARALTALGLALTATLLGCQDQLNQLATNYPQLQPILGGRPKPSPIAVKFGNITGFVFGATGKSQPIPLAFVSSGSVSSNSGNPPQTVDNLPSSSDPDNAPDDGERMFVKHAFDDNNDGQPDGAELPAERVPRKNPPAPVEGVEEYQRKYVYLRTGEFFLEGVPEGLANLRASFGNTTSSVNPITVYPNATVNGITMNLFIPEPIRVEGNAAPRVVEWTGLKPDNGITLQVQPGQVVEGVVQPPTITYKPDPPDVAVTLKAPPGSAGAVIRAVSLVYVFTTRESQAQGLAAQTIGPILIPIPPIIVPPAQDIAFGPPAIINVPVGSASLQAIFDDPSPNRQPGLVVANMEFIDESGFAVQSKTFENLQVAAILRRL